MAGLGLKLSALLVAGLLMTACSSTSTKDDEAKTRATVEDRSINRNVEEDTTGRTQGLEDDGDLMALSLDDSESLLAVRVIYFDYDSANIRADFADTLAAHAAYLSANPYATVTLEGHADERGSREYNLALGERRSLAVRRQLVLLGASAGQVDAVSYGEERPAVDEHDEDAYGLNRRVEMVYP